MLNSGSNGAKWTWIGAIAAKLNPLSSGTKRSLNNFVGTTWTWIGAIAAKLKLRSSGRNRNSNRKRGNVPTPPVVRKSRRTNYNVLYVVVFLCVLLLKVKADAYPKEKWSEEIANQGWDWDMSVGDKKGVHVTNGDYEPTTINGLEINLISKPYHSACKGDG